MTAARIVRTALMMVVLASTTACASRQVQTAAVGNQQAAPVRAKSAMKGFAIEYLIPGAGQIYAGNEWKAVNVLGIIGAAVLVASTGENRNVTGSITALALGTRLWSLYDVPRSINERNKRVAGSAGY